MIFSNQKSEMTVCIKLVIIMEFEQQMSPNWKMHNQTDHVLIDKIWHSSVADIPPFRGADCDNGHCLVVATFRGRL